MGSRTLQAVVAAALVITAGAGYLVVRSGVVVRALIPASTTAHATPAQADPANEKSGETAPKAPASETLELTERQLGSVKVEPVEERAFPVQKTSVGSIDFDEDMSVQVFTPYQGRIVQLFAKLGDDVKKGQPLFTIDSPDLIQAESTLIAAAAVLELTTRTLNRLKELVQTRAIAQKDLEQAVSDQQTAEGALKAARDNVRLFGKSEAEIDHIVSARQVDPILLVPSPIAGHVTARNAAPGLLVQPGNPPAPYTVADVSTMWMLANVAETDSPSFRVGQEVKVRVLAYPDRVFSGRISTIADSVDPNTRRVLVRSEVDDPHHELRSGMFANFVIETGPPIHAVAAPLDGVVREGDGTMTVWVTADRRHFTKRTVKIGLQHDGYDQIVGGLKPGELIATEGALFLSNMLDIASRSG